MDKENIKILIIEDEEALVDVLKTKLEREGFAVEVGTDGEEGYGKIKEFSPDLILLDIVMPKMDGYDVLEKMKENNIKIPVIIISNSGQPVEIEKTKQLGAVDHLIKTQFSPEDVLQMVKLYLGLGESKSPISEESDKKIQLEGKRDENAASNGIKVLLVEDDSFLREISSKKLLKEGFTVYEAIDGEMALNGIESAEPDIVLLDIILPALDGFQILEKIRANPNEKIAKTPVIMLSNLGQEDDIKKAMELGANDYLVKAHFTTEEIVEKIRKTLEK